MGPIKYLYRYEARSYSIVIDAEYDLYGSTGLKLELEKFRIVKVTPKGNWITYGMGSKDTWVSNTTRKRYAHPSKEKALAAYIIRKQYYVGHCKTRLSVAKQELELGNERQQREQNPKFKSGIKEALLGNN